MDNKNFDIIVKRVGNALKEKGFVEQPIQNTNASQINAAFTGTNGSVRILLDNTKKKVELYISQDLDIHPQTLWKLSSSWLFDPEKDGEKEAISISNDFIDLLKPNKKINKPAQTKSDNDSNVDSQFFINRLANAFPHLKEEMKIEQRDYESFRYVTFVKDKAVAPINDLFKSTDNVKIKRFCKLLSDNYENGNKDVRSIITFVILNSIENETVKQKIVPLLSQDLQKAFKASEKFKNKKVKPEKIKKRKSFMSRLMQSAEEQQLQGNKNR